MPTVELTPGYLKRLPVANDRPIELWDTVPVGMCLRLHSSGKASWTFRYRPADGGLRRRVTIGEYPVVGLSEARKRTTRLKGKVSDGADPQRERRKAREAPTLAMAPTE